MSLQGKFVKCVLQNRIATVDMVLWDATRIVPVTAIYGQYSAHGVATGTNEYDVR